MQDSGTPAILYNIYTDVAQAESKWHLVLSTAAVSSVPLHGCFILRSDGVLTSGKVYDRRPKPEPEPEPEVIS